MAISLTGDGLSLNYLTSAQSSSVNVPVGCVVGFKESSSILNLNGTWVTIGIAGGVIVGSKADTRTGGSFGIRIV